MSELKLLGIGEIFEDKELYPRENYGWQTAYQYSQAINAGAEFPPVIVAQFAGKYYLVDGKHRVEAYKMNKQDTIQVELIKVKDRKQLYLEAIKRNIVNGRPLTPYDKAGIILRLRKMDISDVQISKIVQVPIKKFEKFVAERVTNTITGEEIVLKSQLKHLAGTIVEEDLAKQQDIYGAVGQEHIVEQMLRLLETKKINTKNPTIMNKLKIIRKLIQELVLSTRKR